MALSKKIGNKNSEAACMKGWAYVTAKTLYLPAITAYTGGIELQQKSNSKMSCRTLLKQGINILLFLTGENFASLISRS
jgi:metallophosphoesterase superfamily enzyme